MNLLAWLIFFLVLWSIGYTLVTMWRVARAYREDRKIDAFMAGLEHRAAEHKAEKRARKSRRPRF